MVMVEFSIFDHNLSKNVKISGTGTIFFSLFKNCFILCYIVVKTDKESLLKYLINLKLIGDFVFLVLRGHYCL